MKKQDYIPKTTIERLPLYYRCLEKIETFGETEVVSSKELGGKLGIPSTQVRKDLSYYGDFGRRGVGYDVSVLKKSIGKILGINRVWSAVLVGAGNLGRALVNYRGFRKMGLEINSVFDVDLNKIGNRINEITVQSLKELKEVIEKEKIKIGIITVPAASAQEIADLLIKTGVNFIWNFAPAHLKVPDEVVVRNEDLAVGIASLIYHLSWDDKQAENSEEKNN
ncbi:MAG TPA: redox-sensing transcriptional repressor Rex [Halanaerobiales bacterium]|nr:redox-sensing transcriptional repressor Rex [Halanaerobiales bacterium]